MKKVEKTVPDLQHIIYEHKYDVAFMRSIFGTIICILLILVVAGGFSKENHVDWLLAATLIIPIWQTTVTIKHCLNIRRKMIILDVMRK